MKSYMRKRKKDIAFIFISSMETKAQPEKLNSSFMLCRKWFVQSPDPTVDGLLYYFPRQSSLDLKCQCALF